MEDKSSEAHSNERNKAWGASNSVEGLGLENMHDEEPHIQEGTIRLYKVNVSHEQINLSIFFWSKREAHNVSRTSDIITKHPARTFKNLFLMPLPSIKLLNMADFSRKTP